VLAQEEARLLNHDYIGTEHLLLGLAAEGQGVAALALERLGIGLEALRSQVQQLLGRGERAPSGHLPFTPRAKTVLVLSLRESQQLGHRHIGTEHLLLGLVREGEGVAAQVLVKLGADPSRTRLQVIELLSGYTSGDPSPEQTAGPRPVPGELRDVEEQLAQVRRHKVAAVEAQDFDRARALRDQELQLLERLAEQEGQWRPGVDVAAVVQENRRLGGEVQRLRDLLRQHGIEPDGGTEETA
jgi:ATP-dependent Clp protease ATP-binding subunit ClpA